MIIKGLFELVYNLLNVILTPFQLVPDLPTSFYIQLDRYLEFIFAPVKLFACFFDVNFIRVCIPILIVVANMEHIWDGILWILKKLPFVGIE